MGNVQLRKKYYFILFNCPFKLCKSFIYHLSFEKKLGCLIFFFLPPLLQKNFYFGMKRCLLFAFAKVNISSLKMICHLPNAIHAYCQVRILSHCLSVLQSVLNLGDVNPINLFEPQEKMLLSFIVYQCSKVSINIAYFYVGILI